MTSSDAVVEDGAIGTPETLSLARVRDRFVATWERREVTDAGPDLAPRLTGFEVVVLDARGALVSRETVTAPPDLAARRGSVVEDGVVVEDGAKLVHWVQSTTTTDADGRVRTAAGLKVTYGEVIFEPARGECTNCRLSVAFASLGDESVAVVRVVPDIVVPVLGMPPPAPSFVALRLRREGTVSTEELPWLVPPPSPSIASAEGGLGMTVDEEGRIVVTTDGAAWLVDRALRPLSGPIALPAADGRIAWGAASDAPTVAWSVAPDDDARAKRQIFVSPGERLTSGREAVAVDRDGADAGVLFESANRLLFADVAAGKKRGGDVLVRVLGDGTIGSEYGAVQIQEHIALLARGAGAFTAVTLGSGALTRAEIVCAP